MNSVGDIRSSSNKRIVESPDDFYRQMHQSKMISSSPVRSPPTLSPFLRSINFTTGLYYRRISSTQISPSATHESDDDGYDSLASSNRTLSFSSSSSSVSSDFGEYSIDHQYENSSTG
jgi:hypothetical protein